MARLRGMQSSRAPQPIVEMNQTMGEWAESPDLRLELLSQPRLLAPVRALLSSLAQRLGFNDASGAQISLAVDEALCNVINHGYERRTDGRIWLSIWARESDGSLRIVIEDAARQVDPQSIRSRDLEDIRPGGLGVYIIRKIMDEVHYEKREGGGMRLIMCKRRSDNEQQGGTAGDNERNLQQIESKK